jgi:hypothetical protein
VDLTAGPVSYGYAHSGDGRVGVSTFPRVHFDTVTGRAFEGATTSQSEFADSLFHAQLVAVVRSAVEAVVAPDVVWTDARVSTRALRSDILVTVVVVAHSDGDVASLASLRRNLAPLLLPDQSLNVSIKSVAADDPMFDVVTTAVARVRVLRLQT